MNEAPRRDDIRLVRDASRRMVRHLGFLRPTLAGADLSPSAVHAVIEIGRLGERSANQLGQVLSLDKSTVSRMLGRLVARQLVVESASQADGRAKILRLTEQGRALLAKIDLFADRQVGAALRSLERGVRAQVVAGLAAYADALQPAGEAAALKPEAGVEILEGYLPDALGRIVAMHGVYYGRDWRFPPVFEAKVAAGLADFVPRLDRPGNQLWLAVQQGEILGSASIDGEDLGEGKAHLRWMIVDGALRGSGTGRRLLARAVEFCDAHGFAEIHLWTFRGLDAARHLYESAGFRLAEEWQGSQWGMDLPEQRFVRRNDRR